MDISDHTPEAHHEALTPMTKAELQKSHDALARFLVHLCRFSDNRIPTHGVRMPEVEEHYQGARKLIKRAGFKYAPPSVTPND
jgi:hypothetical protein